MKRNHLFLITLLSSLTVTSLLAEETKQGALTGLEHRDKVVILTKNTGLSIVEKNGTHLLSTLNGRYIISGDFKVTDTVTGRSIESLKDARTNQDYFSPEKTPMVNKETYLPLGAGENNVYVILNPLKQRKQLSQLIETFQESPEKSNFYQARFVFLGRNDPEMGYAVMLTCNLENIKKSSVTSKAELCNEGLQRMGKMHMIGIMYDFDKLQEDFPIVIKKGKVYKKANLVNYFN